MRGRLDAEHVVKSLWSRLPGIARRMISDAHYPPHERNVSFLRDPDDPHEHETRWHQWGIITHSRMLEKYWLEEVPGYLNRWGQTGPVAQKMAEAIDGAGKGDLLRISIPLHDIGKFAVRRVTLARDNSITVSFKGHAEESGKIIRQAAFAKMLRTEMCLTEQQVEYVAGCAERHYALGHVREVVKKVRQLEFNFSFVRSADFRAGCLQVLRQNAGFELEVGLLWLADSLAKTEVHVHANTDGELHQMGPNMKALLKQRGLNDKEVERLLPTAREIPIGVAAAEEYLKLWAEAWPGN